MTKEIFFLHHERQLKVFQAKVLVSKIYLNKEKVIFCVIRCRIAVAYRGNFFIICLSVTKLVHTTHQKLIVLKKSQYKGE
jgi:hypothetical protein